MKIQSVPISEIGSPPKFGYHIELIPLDLYRSIQKFGVKIPLWLIESDKLLIIDGHRRFQISRELKLRKLPAIVFKEDKFNQLFLSALSINMTNDKLSAIEKLRVFRLSQKYFDNPLTEEILDILDLKFLNLEEDIIQFINNLPVWLVEYLHNIDLSIKNIIKLILFPIPEYENWFKMAYSLNFKGNELLNLLEMIHEICQRDEIGADKSWSLLSVDSLMKESMNQSQISHRIKKKVYDTRYPILNKINRVIRDRSKILMKGSAGFLHVHWDESLEESRLELRFAVCRTEELDLLASFAGNTKNRQVIKEILTDMNFLSADK